MSVCINLEIGHEVTVLSKRTKDEVMHDWQVFVKGIAGTYLKFYIENVVFHLHETFPNPKRMIKEPPYLVKWSAVAASRYRTINLLSQQLSENLQKCLQPAITQNHFHTLVSVQQNKYSNILLPVQKTSLLQNEEIIKISNNLTRSVTKFSLKKGKRKSLKAVIKRFYRLNWGGWIRTKTGRHKKLWKKSPPQKRRLREHVFVNATQCTLLDKMVTKYWRKPKYYVDDPYEPYHEREEFAITRKRPL